MAAQLALSPPVVVLSEAERIGSYTVRNTLEVAQEVTVEFRFGYPRSDSVGVLSLAYDDTASERRYSIASWMRAFPRQFVLPAGGEQIVRLMARPPAGLEDGIYWTRLVTTSMAQAPALAETAGGVSAQINLRFEQITTVLYRRGSVQTAVRIGEPRVHAQDTARHLLVPLSREGSAPYLGVATVRMMDGTGRIVHEQTSAIAVYFDLLYRVILPVPARQPGSYAVEVMLTTERADLPRDRLPQAEPLLQRFTLTFD